MACVSLKTKLSTSSWRCNTEQKSPCPQDAYTPAKDDTVEKWIQEGGAAKTENHKRDYIWELEAGEGISEMGLLELKPKLKKKEKVTRWGKTGEPQAEEAGTDV